MASNKLQRTNAPAATWIVRWLAGVVFLLEGIKKFLFVAQWGAGRFTRIGLPHPQLLGPFVGVVEIVCGLLLIIGLFTRFASFALLIDISVAILTTKVPIYMKQGWWPAEAEARTDYSMFMALLFLLIVGAGVWSLDARSGSSGSSRKRV